MQQRTSASWVAVGALAVVGGFWLTTRSLQIAQVEGAWLPFAGHFIGALLAGALMVAHAALRPWREPVAAAVVAVGVLAVMFLVLPQPWFSWVAARSPYPWLMAFGLAGVCAAGALCGGMIARRVASTTPHTAKLVLLSALTITGCSVALVHLAGGSGLASGRATGLLFVMMMLGVVFGGFVVQRMVTTYRPWTIGGGATLLALSTLAEAGPSTATMKALMSSLLLGCIGAIGARLARRWVVTPGPTPHDTLPSARLR